jgi:hypothetical protein
MGRIEEDGKKAVVRCKAALSSSKEVKGGRLLVDVACVSSTTRERSASTSHRD